MPSPFADVRRVEVACPGALLQRLIPEEDAGAPFFTIPHGPLFPDQNAVRDRVRKIGELDVVDKVFVGLAHDMSLRDVIPLFP